MAVYVLKYFLYALTQHNLICIYCTLDIIIYNSKIFFVLLCQLSILVHPDKNQDDPDRAQQAFES
jgi:hypothetical protein